MTENQIDGITKALFEIHRELRTIRSAMFTKEDEENIQNLRLAQHETLDGHLRILLQSHARIERLMVEYRPADKPATNPPAPGLQERVDTVTGRLLDRI